jgi:hypothetical protein
MILHLTTHPAPASAPQPQPYGHQGSTKQGSTLCSAPSHHFASGRFPPRVVARTTASSPRQAASTFWQMPVASWRKVGCPPSLCLLKAAYPGLRGQEVGAEGQREDNLAGALVDVPLALLSRRVLEEAAHLRFLLAPDLARHQNEMHEPPYPAASASPFHFSRR